MAQAVDLALQLGSEITVVSVVSEMKLPFSAESGLWERESHEGLMRKVLESLNSSMLRVWEDHLELKIEVKIEAKIEE